MAMFLKHPIDCIFLDRDLVMILTCSSNTKLPPMVSEIPRLSEATMCVAKSIADCMARWRFSTKISWVSSSSRRSGTKPVTCFILLRYFCIAVTFANTTSLSGINSSLQNVLFTIFSYPLQIIILVDRVGKKLVEIFLVIRINQYPILEYLHFQNRRSVIQDNKIYLPFEDQ